MVYYSILDEKFVQFSTINSNFIILFLLYHDSFTGLFRKSDQRTINYKLNELTTNWRNILIYYMPYIFKISMIFKILILKKDFETLF